MNIASFAMIWASNANLVSKVFSLQEKIVFIVTQLTKDVSIVVWMDKLVFNVILKIILFSTNIKLIVEEHFNVCLKNHSIVHCLRIHRFQGSITVMETVNNCLFFKNWKNQLFIWVMSLCFSQLSVLKLWECNSLESFNLPSLIWQTINKLICSWAHFYFGEQSMVIICLSNLITFSQTNKMFYLKVSNQWDTVNHFWKTWMSWWLFSLDSFYCPLFWLFYPKYSQ